MPLVHFNSHCRRSVPSLPQYDYWTKDQFVAVAKGSLSNDTLTLVFSARLGLMAALRAQARTQTQAAGCSTTCQVQVCPTKCRISAVMRRHFLSANQIPLERSFTQFLGSERPDRVVGFRFHPNIFSFFSHESVAPRTDVSFLFSLQLNIFSIHIPSAEYLSTGVLSSAASRHLPLSLFTFLFFSFLVFYTLANLFY